MFLGMHLRAPVHLLSSENNCSRAVVDMYFFHFFHPEFLSLVKTS
jgi:hypothetical protein